ncbi:amino acid ABC transporter ATP-binding protein [Alkalihalobacillus sp. FSL W8-0930]
MIEVKQIKKRFGEHIVLDGIDLNVKNGEVVAVIGPSGSGKSTLLRCLNLLEQPEAGMIQVGNTQLNAASYSKKEAHALRRESAMVFQNYNLFKNKTVLENIAASLRITKKMSKAEAHKIAFELLEQVGLTDKAQSYPITLSGGQQQRVGIARALAVNPTALLLDEPTSALDPELVSEVLQVIRSIAKKDTTMIIVTHELAFAREVADRVIFMADGHIVEEGNARELFDNPKQERTKRFIKQLNQTEEADR